MPAKKNLPWVRCSLGATWPRHPWPYILERNDKSRASDAANVSDLHGADPNLPLRRHCSLQQNPELRHIHFQLPCKRPRAFTKLQPPCAITCETMQLSISWLSICLSVYLSIYLPIDLSIYLSVCLAIYPFIHLSIYLSIHPSIYLSTYLSIHPSIHLSIYLSVYLSIYRSIYLPIYLSIYLSIYFPSYICSCLGYIHACALSLCQQNIKGPFCLLRPLVLDIFTSGT